MNALSPTLDTPDLTQDEVNAWFAALPPPPPPTIVEEKHTFVPELLAPPLDWADAQHYEFIGLVMHFHTHHCMTCGALEKYTETFRAFGRRNSPSADNYKRMLRWDGHVPPHMGVVLMSLPTREVPICHHCLTTTRDGEAVLLVTSNDAWNEALKRDRLATQAAKREATRAPSTTAHKSAVDLL